MPIDPFDRRTFMRRAGATGLTLSGLSTVLAACGGIEGEGGGAKRDATATPASVSHPEGPIDQLTVANWPLYIDKRTNKQFVKQLDVGDFKYTEEINDNDSFFGKVRQPLAQGQDIERDIVVLTDWMAARWVRLGYVEPIDKRNVPNMDNLQPTLADPQWDPGRRHSLPWQSGMTGIGYDRRRVGREIRSYEDMFDPEFKGRVSFFSDARDASNFILLKNGIKPEDASIDDILGAIEEIDQANRKGQIRRFTGNDYTTDLANGNLWICQAWSGDVIQLQADNPNLEFVIPDEGGTIWSDNMLMPANGDGYYGAEAYMNYVYDPEVAARIAAYVNYVTPVVGAREVLEKQDPELAQNPLIFPDDETLANLHPYPDLDEEEERRMNEAMQAVVGA